MNSSLREDEDIFISRVGPWKDKEEFFTVYQLIFSDLADWNTKKEACNWMTVWQLRRQNLTPASVLSTLAILEVKLKDDQNCVDKSTLNEIRTLYSNAFTRFLNYMTSIMQNKNLKTMYMSAKQLGIESFLVDLRHLCAHGQVMPSLDVFRRTSDYCLNWLHTFYWTREVETIKNATVDDIRLKTTIEFEEKVFAMFIVYDLVTEAMYRRYRYVDDLNANENIKPEQLGALKAYSATIRSTKLSVILTHITNELTALARGESRVRGSGKLFCQVIFRATFFIETAAKFSNITSFSDSAVQQKMTDFISLHQNLFRSMAICGYIETSFRILVDICEDDHEDETRRRGAQFWANQIATGFILFKEVKRLFKAKKDKNKDFIIDLAPVNTDTMTKEIRNIYKDMGVNCNSILIFGDTIQRPWTLTFDRVYINERINNCSRYTADVIEKCLALSEPPLTTDQYQTLQDLITKYVAGENPSQNIAERKNRQSMPDSAGDLIYTVEEHLLNQIDKDNSTSQTVEGDAKYGIWTECSDDVNWAAVPLGRLPWE